MSSNNQTDDQTPHLPPDPSDWRGPGGHVLSRDAVLAQVPDERTDPPRYRAVTVGDVVAMQEALTEERSDFESFAGHHAATEAALASERQQREQAEREVERLRALLKEHGGDE